MNKSEALTRMSAIVYRLADSPPATLAELEQLGAEFDRLDRDFDTMNDEFPTNGLYSEDGLLHNRDDILWADAPIPRRWHRCTAWTYGYCYGSFYERCACGAVRRDRRSWFDRNTRRKGRRR